MTLLTKPGRPVAPPPPAATKVTFMLWRAGLSCGLIYVVLGLVFWAVVAKFLPPPHQDWSAERVQEFFSDQPRVKIGLVGYLFIAPLWVPMSIVISRIMARIEGPHGILNQVEFFGGIGTTFATLFSGVAWLAASYHIEERTAGEVMLLNDVGWFVFNMTFVLTFLQYLAFAVCVLLQRGDAPLFPRWLAWLSVGVLASFMPILLMPFFPDSPFAWHGLITYWVALGLFFAWVPCVLFYAFKAVTRIERAVLEEQHN